MSDIPMKQSEMMLDALQYAHDHDLDIHNKDDVAKILEFVDPNHTQNLDEFMNQLSSADDFLDLIARENKDKKIELPN